MAVLTDAQWSAAIADVFARQIAGTITEAQAAAEIAAATENWPTRTLSNAGLALRVSTVLANLKGLIETDGPPTLEQGAPGTFAFDSVNIAFYGPKTADGWGEPRSLLGNPGPAGVITGVDVELVAWNEAAEVVLGGAPEARSILLKLPRAKDGVTPNVSFEIVMVANGEPATVVQSGTVEAPHLIFNIPSPLPGVDGKNVEIQKSATHIQWRRVGDVAWVDLIALTDLMVKGDKGDAFEFDAKPADMAARAAYDAQPEGFTVLVMDTGMVYARIGATPGVWSDGFPFGQTQNAILEALSNLNATPGLLYQSGAAVFEKRAIGAASDTDVPDRLAGDGRWRRQGVAVPLTEVDGLSDALDDKADAAATLVLLGGKEDKTAKGAANGYAGLGADGKVPAGQLPALSGGGLEVGDILTTARAPGAKYLLADGSSYLRAAWPELSPLLPDGGSLPLTAWTQRTLPAAGLWAAITYGGGQFVALCYNSNIAATSPDGVTWTQRTLPATANWASVVYGNGRYVAIAKSGTIAATSLDGITWTQRVLPISSNWHAVTYGNGMFVAISNTSGTVAASSPDGVTWTSRTLPTSSAWAGVAFGNGVFVAIGGSGTTAATSPDGVIWTARTLPSSATWYAVAFGGGAFMAISSGTTGVSATSPDGALWSAKTLPAGPNWTSVTYGAGRFAIVGAGGASATSLDGATWASVSLPQVNTWLGVAYGAGVFASLMYASATAVAASSNKLTDSTLFVVPRLAPVDLVEHYIKGEA